MALWCKAAWVEGDWCSGWLHGLGKFLPSGLSGVCAKSKGLDRWSLGPCLSWQTEFGLTAANSPISGALPMSWVFLATTFNTAPPDRWGWRLRRAVRATQLERNGQDSEPEGIFLGAQWLTLCFQCSGCGFNPRSSLVGEVKIPHVSPPKNRNKTSNVLTNSTKMLKVGHIKKSWKRKDFKPECTLLSWGWILEPFLLLFPKEVLWSLCGR